ncbi:MAG TPA: hypothetical protein VGF67_05320 [Ktedonobacteraceae bacterium]
MENITTAEAVNWPTGSTQWAGESYIAGPQQVQTAIGAAGMVETGRAGGSYIKGDRLCGVRGPATARSVRNQWISAPVASASIPSRDELSRLRRGVERYLYPPARSV